MSFEYDFEKVRSFEYDFQFDLEINQLQEMIDDDGTLGLKWNVKQCNERASSRLEDAKAHREFINDITSGRYKGPISNISEVVEKTYKYKNEAEKDAAKFEKMERENLREIKSIERVISYLKEQKAVFLREIEIKQEQYEIEAVVRAETLEMETAQAEERQNKKAHKNTIATKEVEKQRAHEKELAIIKLREREIELEIARLQAQSGENLSNGIDALIGDLKGSKDDG